MSVPGLDMRADVNSDAISGLDGGMRMNSENHAAVKTTVSSNMMSIAAL